MDDENSSNAQVRLDHFKLRTGIAVVEMFDLATIREKSLSNLARWQDNEAWCSAYDEWRTLMTSGSDDEVIATMTGRDENSNRLRQSSPCTGLLDQQTVERLRQAPARK